jgi:membrane-associated phospholipid phosphatase
MQEKPPHHDAEEPSASIIDHAQEEVARGRVPWYRASRRAQIFILLYFAEFILFALLATFVHFHPVNSVDITITLEFQENHTPWLQATMIVVSYLGYHFVLFSALVLITAALFWLVHLRLEALLIVALSVVSSALNVALKALVNRPRPSANLVEIIQGASGQSFPSGHVMSYVAYFGLLFSLGVILLKRDRWWHYLLLLVPGLFVVLIGPSRIYLGDHWASDVLGAYLLGALLLGIALWIYLGMKSKGVRSL